MAETVTPVYPHFVVENNKNPNKFYAFPVIGFLIKILILLPVFIEVMFLGIAAFFVLIINWFVISFTNKYWDNAYRFFLSLMRLTTKIKLFILGITDTYPGFTLDTKGRFELDIPKPEKPNVWLAIPLLGIVIRGILLIPYFIFSEVMERGSGLAMVVSWFAVLFKGRFPESLYEFEKDAIRVSLSASSYMLGLSDKYPSFSISMNHQTIKILLIIAGALLTAHSMNDRMEQKYYNDRSDYQNYNHTYKPRVEYGPQPVNNNTY